MLNEKIFLHVLLFLIKGFYVYNMHKNLLLEIRGDRWSRGQDARRAIAEAKQRSQWSVIGWVNKIYYLKLLHASEGTLSRWSRLHLQSLAPTPGSRRVDVETNQ
jgi:hypothetical protein